MKHCAALIREYGPAQLHLPSTHLPHTHARSILKKRKKQILEYICTGVDIHRVDFTSPRKKTVLNFGLITPFSGSIFDLKFKNPTKKINFVLESVVPNDVILSNLVKKDFPLRPNGPQPIFQNLSSYGTQQTRMNESSYIRRKNG